MALSLASALILKEFRDHFAHVKTKTRDAGATQTSSG